MKIVIAVFAKPDIGLGHWYRSIALADELKNRGHFVWVCGNRMLLDKSHLYYQMRDDHPDDLLHILDQIRPDYLVLDLQKKVPEYVYEICDNYSIKTLVLNGVGRDEEDKASLVIVQGFPSKKISNNTYYGNEYVILRPELFKFTNRPIYPWFVWGGAGDKMELLKRFMENNSQQSIMVSNNFAKHPPAGSGNHTVYADVKDDAIFALMSTCEKACVAMGMIVWELVALRIPTYVFSWSEGHLKFAERMSESGLINYYPKVGLPKNDEDMSKFLSREFIPRWDFAPDEKGASRIVDLMEVL